MLCVCVCYAMQGCGWSSPDYIPLMIASTIIGNFDRTQGQASNMGNKLAQVRNSPQYS